MTSWIVSHTDRFKTACSERAVNNMLSEFGSSDFGWFMKAYMGVFPFEDVSRTSTSRRRPTRTRSRRRS